MPKISCIMPVYNTEKYLDECIESILNQTFTDFEFIISDDGSTDSSKEIIKKYAKKDNRIIFLDNPINRGIVANLNDCLKKSSGEYIAIMESDDISMNDRFKIQSKYLDNNENITLLGTWGDIINENGEYKYTWKTNLLKDEIYKNCLLGTQFNTPGIMFRKKIINKLGKFKNGIIWDTDFYLNLIFNNYECINIDKILIKKRELQTGALSKNLRTVIINLFVIRNKFISNNKYKIKSKFKYRIKIVKDFLYGLTYFYIIKLLNKIGLYKKVSKLYRKFILGRNY